MSVKITGYSLSGNKMAIKPLPCGKIAAPVFSNFLKFPAVAFSYRRIEKGTWGASREASFFCQDV